MCISSLLTGLLSCRRKCPSPTVMGQHRQRGRREGAWLPCGILASTVVFLRGGHPEECACDAPCSMHAAGLMGTKDTCREDSQKCGDKKQIASEYRRWNRLGSYIWTSHARWSLVKRGYRIINVHLLGIVYISSICGVCWVSVNLKVNQAVPDGRCTRFPTTHTYPCEHTSRASHNTHWCITFKSLKVTVGVQEVKSC